MVAHSPMFASNGKPNNSSINDDTRIGGYDPVIAPALVQAEVPVDDETLKFIDTCRREASDIINCRDDRLLVIVGPCSLHDESLALDYAQRLKVLIEKHRNELHIIMRCYLEKPRTIVGWKGMINDPDMDGSYKINKGIKKSRRLYLDILKHRVGVASEMLDTIMPQYFGDLVCWGAIGARTTECQLHRELASGLSFPIGFKNATGGDVKIAIDAMQSSLHPHHFLSITKQGVVAIVTTNGNEDTHIILRGSTLGPNYSSEHIQKYKKELLARKQKPSIMVDCSHGNSQKDHNNQPKVAKNIADQIAAGESAVTAVMIESNIYGGRQDLPDLSNSDQNVNNGVAKAVSLLKYGVSITDACIDFETTQEVIEMLADAIKTRRSLLKGSK